MSTLIAELRALLPVLGKEGNVTLSTAAVKELLDRIDWGDGAIARVHLQSLIDYPRLDASRYRVIREHCAANVISSLWIFEAACKVEWQKGHTHQQHLDALCDAAVGAPEYTPQYKAYRARYNKGGY